FVSNLILLRRVTPKLQARSPVHAGIYTWMDLSSTSLVSAILSRVLAEGVNFQFDRMGHEEPLTASFNRDQAIREWSTNVSTRADLVYGDLIMERAAFPRSGLIANWQRKPSGLWLNHLGFWVDGSYLEDETNRNRFLQVLVDFFALTRAGYGNSRSQSEWEEKFW